MNKLIILALFALIGANASAQGGIEQILESVEQNNITLRAERQAVVAKSLEAKVGNSLENPTVSYDRMWGSPSELGKTGEINATQAFDFPTVYANRNKLAKLRAEQYGRQYAVIRQQILLDAKLAYIELVSCKQIAKMLDRRWHDAERVASIYSKMVSSGNANILEKNKIDHEVIIARNTSKLNHIQISSLENKLANLNGGEIVQIVVPQIVVTEFEPIRSIEQMIELYKTSDPQLQAYLSEQNAAQREIKLSRSQSLPKLELGYRHEFALGERFNGVTVGMSIPMFGNKNNVKRAKAQAEYSKIQTQSGVVNIETTLRELYQKESILKQTIIEYDNLDEPCNCIELINKALESGQISVIEYFSELGSYYNVWESRISLISDYRTVVARINMVEL